MARQIVIDGVRHEVRYRAAARRCSEHGRIMVEGFPDLPTRCPQCDDVLHTIPNSMSGYVTATGIARYTREP